MSHDAGLQKAKQRQELCYAEKHPCFIKNQISFVFSDYKANAWEISQAIHYCSWPAQKATLRGMLTWVGLEPIQSF